jgi:hypothetical protein
MTKPIKPPANSLTPLHGALDWASRGLHVFPITAAAKAPPLVPDWENAATTDVAQINQWAREFPNCNFGCAPGRSGHVVFDVDCKDGKDGLAELERLAADHGFEIPDTLIVATPNGGFHLYFKGTAQSSAGKIAPGVDVRARGGYVLVPGSVLHD